MDHMLKDNAREKSSARNKSLPAKPYKQFHALHKEGWQNEPDLIVLDADGELWKRSGVAWRYPQPPATWALLDVTTPPGSVPSEARHREP